VSYSEKAESVAQQMVRAADHPTRVRAALNMLKQMDIGAEVTDDDKGTLVYIPKKR
jgi:hypothetical protein